MDSSLCVVALGSGDGSLTLLSLSCLSCKEGINTLPAFLMGPYRRRRASVLTHIHSNFLVDPMKSLRHVSRFKGLPALWLKANRADQPPCQHPAGHAEWARLCHLSQRTFQNDFGDHHKSKGSTESSVHSLPWFTDHRPSQANSFSTVEEEPQPVYKILIHPQEGWGDERGSTGKGCEL